MKYKNCVDCGRNKSEVLYNRIYQTTGRCINCRLKISYQNNRERALERKRVYYYSHREEISLSGKKYLAKNRASIKLKNQKYLENNREIILERQKRWRKTASGKEKLKLIHKRYRQTHPERILAWSTTNRRKVPHGPCVVCGAEKTHRHHPDPQKRLLIIDLCPLHHKWVHLGKIVL